MIPLALSISVIWFVAGLALGKDPHDKIIAVGGSLILLTFALTVYLMR